MARRLREVGGQDLSRGLQLALARSPARERVGSSRARVQAGRRSAIAVLLARFQSGGRGGEGICPGRPRGGFKLLKFPHGAGRAAADSGRQSGPPGAGSRAAEAAQLEGNDRDQPQLHHGGFGDVARAAGENLWTRQSADDQHAGGFRRRLSGNPHARHPRQRDSLHRRGRRKGGTRNAQAFGQTAWMAT